VDEARAPLLLDGDDEDVSLFEGVQLEEPTAPASVTPLHPTAPTPMPSPAPPPPAYSEAVGTPAATNLPPGQYNPYAYSVGKPPESPALSGNQAQAIMHMPDLPCALEEWTDFLPMVKAWLYLSIATLIFSIFTFFPGVFVGLLAIVAASMHVCKCCKGDPSLAGPVAVTYVLAMITAFIDGFIVFLIGLQWLFLVGSGCGEAEMKEDGKDGYIEKGLEEEEQEGKPECFVIVMVISVTLGWYLLHLWVTLKVLARAKRVRDLLNPITSGVMVL